jgi:hypothetical protein
MMSFYIFYEYLKHWRKTLIEAKRKEKKIYLLFTSYKLNSSFEFIIQSVNEI